MTDNNNGIVPSGCTIILGKQKIKISKLKHAHRLFVSSMKFENENIQNTKHFWIMGIDNDGYVNCVYNILHGLPNFDRGVTLLDVFQIAITRGCTRVIIAHNRPEGEPLNPTSEEKNITNRLYHYARHINVKLIDHLIINFKEYFSYQKKGDMLFIKEDIKFQTCLEAKNVIDDRMEKKFNKGKFEGDKNRSIETAKSLLADGLGIDFISKHTDLCLKDIEAIKNKFEETVSLAKKMIGDNADTNRISEATNFTIEHVEWIKKEMETGDDSPNVVNINSIKWIKK